MHPYLIPMSLLSFTKKIIGGAPSPAEKPAAPKAPPTPSELAAAPRQAAGRIGLIPLLTEKSTTAHQQTNTVAFRVAASATKGQIKAAITSRYHVVPQHIRTVAVMGKLRRRGATVGLTNAWKKAYISLPAGKTIDLGV